MATATAPGEKNKATLTLGMLSKIALGFSVLSALSEKSS